MVIKYGLIIFFGGAVMKKSYEYFPGANTPKGFYSYYGDILKSNEANRIIVLKGGPGSGKSTLMKKAANILKERECDAEKLHCSSDVDSLDGVCSRQLGFLILDGTAPHIVEPRLAGAVDEIVNLGDCWSSDMIKKEREIIEDISIDKANYFKKAYACLKAADAIQRVSEGKISLVDERKIYEAVENIRSRFDLGYINYIAGSERKAFMSALTPSGKISYAKTFAQVAEFICYVKSKRTDTLKKFMQKCTQLFTDAGYNVRTFYSFMRPDEVIEHIYVPALDVFITSEDESIMRDVICDNMTLEIDSERQNINSDEFEEASRLINMAHENLKQAKSLHAELEKHYTPYMDFGKVQSICERVLEDILSMQH